MTGVGERNALGLPWRLADPPERDRSSAPAGVIDAHVHVFPPRLAAAVRRWFDRHAWHLRYRLDAEGIDAFMAARGVDRYLALHYAHTAGLAEHLNRFALEFAASHPRCVPCATVLPGEPDAEGILRRALGAGARAVKIHCHVQRLGPDDRRLDPVYRQVSDRGVLLMIHCGDGPALPGYGFDVQQMCTPAALERALQRYPQAKVCVPHLGFSQTPQYLELLDRYPNLYLDTAMALSGYFDVSYDDELLRRCSGRILYGTDFPHIPYAWDRDLRAITQARLDDGQRAAILGGNARRLLGLDRRCEP